MNDDSTSIDIPATSIVESSAETSVSSNPLILDHQDDEHQSDPGHCENSKSDDRHTEDKQDDVTIPINDSINSNVEVEDVLRVTIKLALKNGETLTLSLENVESVLDIRKYLTESFSLPLEHISLTKDGRVLNDETKLKELGVKTMGVLELELQLKDDDDDININRERIYEGGCISTVDVINVPCKNRNDIAVEIEYPNDNKEWLGGYKDRKSRKTFHNAISQTTIPSMEPSNSIELRKRLAKQTQTNELGSNYTVKYGKKNDVKNVLELGCSNKRSIDYVRPIELAINDQNVLTLAAAPKVFFGRGGQRILMETLDTQRAKTIANLNGRFDHIRTNDENMKLIEDLKQFFASQSEDFRFKDDVLRLLTESLELLTRGLKINSITEIRIKKYIYQYAVSLITNSENSSKSTHPQIVTIADLSPYKAILSALRYDEINSFACYSSVCHRLEITDMVYLVDRIWNNASIFGDCVDLNQLRMVRWNLNAEWSPHNCVLISKYRVKLHLKRLLIYDPILECQIRNKHLIAKVHFCEISDDGIGID